eukprot:3010577-Rhodomonas_salina.2
MEKVSTDGRRAPQPPSGPSRDEVEGDATRSAGMTSLAWSSGSGGGTLNCSDVIECRSRFGWSSVEVSECRSWFGV